MAFRFVCIWVLHLYIRISVFLCFGFEQLLVSGQCAYILSKSAILINMRFTVPFHKLLHNRICFLLGTFLGTLNASFYNVSLTFCFIFTPLTITKRERLNLIKRDTPFPRKWGFWSKNTFKPAACCMHLSHIKNPWSFDNLFVVFFIIFLHPLKFRYLPTILHEHFLFIWEILRSSKVIDLSYCSRALWRIFHSNCCDSVWSSWLLLYVSHFINDIAFYAGLTFFINVGNQSK